VLDLPVSEELDPIRSKKPVRLPVMLSQQEAAQLLSAMMAKLVYGGGLRIMEALRLQIQDIDSGNGYPFIGIRY
jgi:integrase